MSSRTYTTLLCGSVMLQQTYAADLWYLSYMMTIAHTDEGSEITASFIDESKHAHSSKTAKDCSSTFSKNTGSSSQNVPGNESSAITESFGNDSTHAHSSKTVEDYSATVSKISAKSANRAMTARYVYASWKTGVYLVMVKALLTSFAIEVQGDLPGITDEDCTDTGATTEHCGDFRTWHV